MPLRWVWWASPTHLQVIPHQSLHKALGQTPHLELRDELWYVIRPGDPNPPSHLKTRNQDIKIDQHFVRGEGQTTTAPAAQFHHV